MNLESLKSSKFEAFKENQLLSLMNITGGTKYVTGYNCEDCWTDETSKDIQCTDGSKYDVCSMTDGQTGNVFYEQTEGGEKIALAPIIGQP